jgi:hypothetical protein
VLLQTLNPIVLIICAIAATGSRLLALLVEDKVWSDTAISHLGHIGSGGGDNQFDSRKAIDA